jgi:hypothetical protein
MVLDIINKVLVILFVLSSLNVVRHTYYFIQGYAKSKTENYEKYKLGDKSLLLLGISLSYIITSIFIGITI